MTDRLYRSPTDRVIAGVAGGLAVWLNLDPSIVRIAWVLLGIFSGGIFVLVYFVMMIVVPLPPPGWVPQARGSNSAGWAPGSPGAPGAPGTGPVAGWDAGTAPGWGAGSAPGWDAGTAPGWGAGAAPGGVPGDASQAGTPGAGTQGAWTTPQQPWVAPKVDTGGAGIVAGAILVLLGIWFLIDQYVDLDWALLWPVVVIVLGVLLIVGAMRRSGIRPG